MKGNDMRMEFILAISSMALLSAYGGGDKGALSGLDKGGDNGSKAGLNDLDKEWRKDFVKSCNSSAVASGAPADFATKACGCTADKIIDQYNLVERAQLSDEKMDEILDQCFKEAGITKG